MLQILIRFPLICMFLLLNNKPLDNTEAHYNERVGMHKKVCFTEVFIIMSFKFGGTLQVFYEGDRHSETTV